MSYKDILVQLDTPDARSRYELAAGLAVRAGGTVTGVYLKTTLINQYNDLGSIGYLPTEDLQALIDENGRAQENAAARAAAALLSAATGAGAASDWRKLDGDTPEALVAAARRADLTILPPPASATPYNVHASPVDVALECGGPVLIAPHGDCPAVGHRVLLAWSGSRESARALRDALPLLVDGAVIEVRTVEAHAQPAVESDGVVEHLQRLGFKVNFEAVVAEDHAVAGVIQAEAVRCGCDLIVLGLYGHARFREFVLGGVSRAMLHAPQVPLLVSH